MISNYNLFEDNNWSKDINIDKNKMHNLLNVPEGEKIKDHYSNGQHLADALVKATGSEKKASSMLAFAANINKEKNIMDDALNVIKKKDYNN